MRLLFKSKLPFLLLISFVTLTFTSLISQDATEKKKLALVPLIQDSTGRIRSFTQGNILLQINHSQPCIGQKIYFELVTPASHGKVILPEFDVYSGSANWAIYCSDRDFSGTDTFVWRVRNGDQVSNSATITVTVIGEDPVPNERTMLHLSENTTKEFEAAYTGGNTGIVYSIKAENPLNGKIEVNGLQLKYTPNPNFVGTDSFAWCFSITSDKSPKPKETKKGIYTIVVNKKGMNDWPQWRGDELRSGYTTMQLPDQLNLTWVREIPVVPGAFTFPGQTKGIVFKDIDYCRPIQINKSLIVIETASDSISAYHTDTGELKWKYYASGALRRAPAAISFKDGTKAVIFSSDDGYVYCLDEATGLEKWKFLAAPNLRKAMCFGRFGSVWPVWASPVIYDGNVYFAAGYIPTYHLYAYCLDAKTGAVKWVNDGRINDIWNNSALGPLAISADHKFIYGSVEGAARPWVLDINTGEYLGHFGVGFGFCGGGRYGLTSGPFASRSGAFGWYADGMGTFNSPEPKEILVGEKLFTFKNVLELGVNGEVASLLAGDNKLFVTTVEGKIYCFSGNKVEAIKFKKEIKPLEKINDEVTNFVAQMLSRKDLKSGLAYVLGINNGRIVEELVMQSNLMVVAVDTDHKKLQALRKKFDEAGLSGTRLTTVEANPLDLLFSPYQAAIITSEDAKASGYFANEVALKDLISYVRPFGGEIWLGITEEQNKFVSSKIADSKIFNYVETQKLKGLVNVSENFIQIKRTGLAEDKLKLTPPFGLIAFGVESTIAPYLPLTETWPGKDTYSLLPFKEAMPGFIPPAPKHTNEKGYPTEETVATDNSIFTSLINPMYSRFEKFVGIPSSGNDGACGVISSRYGDYGLTHGKIASIFDTSENYWGRLFFSEIGGCPGRISAGKSLITVAGHPVPGSACGCSATMQFSSFVLTAMDFEENWFGFQTKRSSELVEEIPVHKIGINFGAPGDRLSIEDNILWTHHPYSGRYGRISYNHAAKISQLPMLPVTYKGKVQSVYHDSHQMPRKPDRYRGWVSASYVKGMQEIVIPLIQPVIAMKVNEAPKIDGNANDSCWDQQRKVIFTPEYTIVDKNRDLGLPKINDECFVMIRYDQDNIYILGGTNAGFAVGAKKSFAITMNSRERIGNDVVFYCENKNKKIIGAQSELEWTYIEGSNENFTYFAEVSIPFNTISKAGLWKDQLIVNFSLSDANLTSQFTPLYYDSPKGVMTESHPYTIRLYFAEMENKSIGQRIFDININGKSAIKNLDIVKEAGGIKNELMKEVKSVEIIENLKLTFTAIKDVPLLSGIEIVGEYEPGVAKENILPTPEIQLSETSGKTPFKVELNARRSSDADGQIDECVWDTGDGRIVKGSIAEHVYTEPGTYLVSLLVRDNRGGLASKQTTITVLAGAPSAFICSIKAKGGDFENISSFEKTLSSDLTSGTLVFKLTEFGTSSYNGKKVVFLNGVSGTIREVKEGLAYIADIKGKVVAGKGQVAGNLKFTTADEGVSIGKSLLFTVSQKGNYDFSDDNKAVTFTGGGKGILKHINNAPIAYIAECVGDIQLGKVTIESGHNFEISDVGNPVYMLVAECYFDWSNGLDDVIKASDIKWFTDSLHSVLIRSPKDHCHKGKPKNTKGELTGFCINGDLDLSAITGMRLDKLMTSKNCEIRLGVSSSVNRCILGNLAVEEKSNIANTFIVDALCINSQGVVNKSNSYFSIAVRDGRLPLENQNIRDSEIGFYNCTANTIDSGGQPGVSLVNCLVISGKKDLLPNRYFEKAQIINCAVINDSKVKLYDSVGKERQTEGLLGSLVAGSDRDYHLTIKDTLSKGNGGASLGDDIDGEKRNGSKQDIGADLLSTK